MNKLVLLSIFLVGLISSLFSQNYIPFPTSNASWIDQEACYESHYQIIGDTIVNGLVYQLLYVNEKAYSQTAQTGCTNSSSFTISGYYAGAYRNDSINKKVFFLPPFQIQDTLLYDFNLSVGDTLKQTYKTNLGFGGPAVTVVRTDSVLYGNAYHKRYTFDFCPSNFLDTLRFIEGIGSNQTFLGPYDICNIDYLVLECFKKNGQTVYSDPLGTCQLITGLTEYSVEKPLNVSISPNPTSGVVKVEIEAMPAAGRLEIVSVEVFDLSGASTSFNLFVPQNFNAQPDKFNQNTNTFVTLSSDRRKDGRSVNKKILDLVNFEPGIYFLKVVLDNGQVVSKRLIKQYAYPFKYLTSCITAISSLSNSCSPKYLLFNL